MAAGVNNLPNPFVLAAILDGAIFSNMADGRNFLIFKLFNIFRNFVLIWRTCAIFESLNI